MFLVLEITFIMQCLVLILVVQVCFTDAITSGIYIDNGNDQTIRNSLLSKSELNDIKSDLLSFLDLPNPPKRNESNNLKKSSLQFVLGVFNGLNKDLYRQKRAVEMESKDDLRQISQANKILTIEGALLRNYSKGRNSLMLVFDNSEVKIKGTILEAKLKLFKNTTLITKKCVVSVYEESINIAKSLETTSNFKGWLELNITETLKKWTMLPKKVLHIKVMCNGIEVDPEKCGFNVNSNEMQPFIVVYVDGHEDMNVRLKRAPVSKTQKNTYPSLLQAFSNPSKEEKCCRLHNLYINFKDIGLDWILVPEGYSASYCAGDCRFPFKKEMMPTNHAIIQNLMHLKSSGRFPKPGCAPSKLKDISIIYDNDSFHYLKIFKGLAVEECGCH